MKAYVATDKDGTQMLYSEMPVRHEGKWAGYDIACWFSHKHERFVLDPKLIPDQTWAEGPEEIELTMTRHDRQTDNK